MEDAPKSRLAVCLVVVAHRLLHHECAGERCARSHLAYLQVVLIFDAHCFLWVVVARRLLHHDHPGDRNAQANLAYRES